MKIKNLTVPNSFGHGPSDTVLSQKMRPIHHIDGNPFYMTIANSGTKAGRVRSIPTPIRSRPMAASKGERQPKLSQEDQYP